MHDASDMQMTLKWLNALLQQGISEPDVFGFE